MRKLGWLMALGFLACSSSERREAPSTSVVRSLRARSALGPAVVRPTLRAGRFEVATKTAMHASLPRAADGAVHLEAGAGIWIELSTVGARSVEGRVEDDAVVYPSAAPNVDSVWAWTEGGVEETRLVHAGGSAHQTLRLRVGPEVGTIEASDGRIFVRDLRGEVRFATSPLIAIDAIGTRKKGETRVAGDLVELDVDTTGLVYPVAVDPAWSAAGFMTVSHDGGCVVTLASGKVLSAGGYQSTPGGSVQSTLADVWDPSTKTWTAVAPMLTGRSVTKCALLASGKVLVVGGGDWMTSYSSAEIYDPASDTWTAAASMSVPRYNFALTKLPSGKVLAMSGDPGRQKAAELYDPAANTWTATGPMNFGRAGFGAAVLPSGKVLVAGGVDAFSGFEQSTAETYDPLSNTWTAVAGMTIVRSFTSIAISGGKAIVVGGEQPAAKGAADIYDPLANSWTRTSLNGPIGYPSAAALPGGRVLAVGGINKTTSVYDPATKTFLPSGDSVYSHGNFPGLAPLSDGSVLLAAPATEVFALQTLGAACSLSGTCASGVCVDGVCCNRACAGTCEACDVAGAVGTCMNVTSGPHGSRSCAPFATCNAGACVTACASDVDCVSDRFCSAGKCVPKKENGLACAASGNCTSGFCVDGVCCDGACNGQCEACDVAGSFGACTAVRGAPRPGKPACTGVAAGTPCGIQCTGAVRDACGYPDTTVACGAAACEAAVERRPSVCNGAGACTDTSKSCGAYACDATACKLSCAGASDCAAGNYCKSGVCVAVDGLGDACSAGSECSTGNCVDGVCCATASCATGATCAGTPKGKCTKVAGSACSIDAECGSGHCADGVCCDLACDGQCEACDVAGSIGTCLGVSGTPHGARKACDTGGTEICAARTCDGATDRKSCAAFAKGTETACRGARCTALGFVGEASCDGKGTCALPKASSCVPYSCDAKGCLSSCSADDQCAAGYACTSGKCEAIAVSCSPDGLESVPRVGTAESCAPYRCNEADGKCRKSCAESNECSNGAVCDTTGGICVEASPEAASGGCSTNRTGGGGGLWLFAVVLGAFFVRRRLVLAAAAGTLACSSRTTSAPEHGKTLLAEVTALGIDVPMAKTSTRPIRVDLPSLHAPARISDGDGTWLEIATDGAAAVAGDRSVEMREIAPGVDALWIADRERLEELRVVRKAVGNHRATYTLRLGPNLHDVSLRRGRVIARDAAGRVRFESGFVYAKDANGEVRDAAVRLERIDDRTATLIVEMPLEGLRAPVVVDPAWSRPADLPYPRRDFTATELPSGKVLLAGGDLSGALYSNADLFDPATGAFTPQGAMSTWHYNHTAFLLKTGKVLIAGGTPGNVPELYDPVSGTWSSAGSPPGYSDGVVMLADGRVFMVGSPSSSLYDPASNSWSTAAGIGTLRYNFATVRLASNKVLVSGGFLGGSTMTSAAEIYDPATDAWTTAPSMPTVRGYHSAALLADGRVLVAGGRGAPYSSSDVYDPTSGAWTTIAMSGTRDDSLPKLANLPNGRVLFAGRPENSEVFDPLTSTWLPAGDMSEARDQYAMGKLASGAVLFAGGVDGGITPTGIEIFKLIPNGGACALGGECNSGNCVSGICCNAACGGTCSACDVAGSVGTCLSLTGDPHYGRSCSGFACAAGSCKATCAVDGDCATGSACFAGVCKSKLGNGTACARAGECSSGQCIDGTCCESSCTDGCAACDVPGHLGRCWPVLGAPHGARSACSGAGLGTACGPSCDGKDPTKCTFATATTPCGAATCKAGVETHASLCNGAGACADAPKGCGVYACGPASCKVSCSADLDCVAGYYCKSGTCQAIEGLGSKCLTDRTCTSGHCVDGACCGSVACAGDETCATGVCKKLPGATCTVTDECSKGVCFDGVCCDRACDGQCEACDVSGSRGTCTPVKGAPHGSRAACAAGTGVCDATTCDGVTAASCAGFVADTSVTCGEPSCADAHFTSAARCDAKGACAKSAAISCAPYACDSVGCLDACASDVQCASGFVCRETKCIAKGLECSKDGTASIALDGTTKACDPYRCGSSGECLTSCATSADCAIGDRCDVSSRTCVPTPEAAEDSGGCSMRGRPVGSGSLLSLLALLGLLARRKKPMDTRA